MTVADAGVIEVAASPSQESASATRGDRARLFADESPYGWERPSATVPEASARFVTFRALLGQLLASLADRLSVGGPVAEQPEGDELGRGDVLDRQPDRLEGGDGVGLPRLDPIPADRPDLHQLRLGQ